MIFLANNSLFVIELFPSGPAGEAGRRACEFSACLSHLHQLLQLFNQRRLRLEAEDGGDAAIISGAVLNISCARRLRLGTRAARTPAGSRELCSPAHNRV